MRVLIDATSRFKLRTMQSVEGQYIYSCPSLSKKLMNVYIDNEDLHGDEEDSDRKRDANHLTKPRMLTFKCHKNSTQHTFGHGIKTLMFVHSHMVIVATQACARQFAEVLS